MKTASRRLALVVICAAFGLTHAAAQQFAYPAKGQSAAQQKKDEAECSQWATSQSGIDPSNPPPVQAAPPPPTTATGVTPGAGARGAARGAVVGEIVGGDSGAGAAAGAAAARGQSRRQNKAQQQQATQQQQQAQGAQQAAFAKARAACLEGRGYSIK